MVAIWKTRTLECRLTKNSKAINSKPWIFWPTSGGPAEGPCPFRTGEDVLRIRGGWATEVLGRRHVTVFKRWHGFFLINFSNISYVNLTFFIPAGVFSLGFEFLLKFFVRSWDLSLEHQGFSDVDHVYNYSLLVLDFQKFFSWFHGAWSLFSFGRLTWELEF